MLAEWGCCWVGCQRSPSSSTQVGAGWARQGLLETGLAADGLRMACTGVTGRLLVPLEFEGLFMVRLELKSCDMGALVRARAETRVD